MDPPLEQERKKSWRYFGQNFKSFDYKDKTFAYYLNGKLKGNWNKAAEGYISDCNDIVWDKTERVHFKL